MTVLARSAALCAALLGLLCPAGALAQGEERIVDFESRVEVKADATMQVTERIEVISTGRKIRRGIFRDFPTTYEDRYGNRVTVGFKVLEVRRDGRAEPYRLEARSNGVRVYIGDKNVKIRPGEHVYTIEYQTDRQIGFFEEFDELYWNVTGNGWDFPIEEARAIVTLPGGAEVLDWAGYTGRLGERHRHVRRSTEAGGGTELKASRALGPGEGLTIALSWPKGFVTPPTMADKFEYFLRDNLAFAIGMVGVVGVFFYFVVMWRKVGRDPKKNTIIARYGPPAGVSPAAARYVMRTAFDEKVFTAAVVSLAVKGYLTIEQGEDEKFVVRKTNETAQLSAGEKALARRLFRDGRTELELDNANYDVLTESRVVLRDSLRTDFEKVYFLRNTGVFLPGLTITGVIAALMVLVATDRPEAVFGLVWLSFWSAAGYYLWRKVVAAWREVGTNGGLFSAITASLGFVPFLAAMGFGVWLFGDASSMPSGGALCAMLLLNVAFYDWLKAPTRLGRRAMDHIEGFKGIVRAKSLRQLPRPLPLGFGH